MTRYAAPMLALLLLTGCGSGNYTPSHAGDADIASGLQWLQFSRSFSQPTYAPAPAPTYGRNVSCTRIGYFVNCDQF